MEVLQDAFYHVQKRYDYYLTQADPRVADWPLMQSYTPTWVLTGLYLFVVYIGPKLMADRPAFHLKWPLVFYNLALVLLNLHIASELFIYTWKANYSYMCQAMPTDLEDKNEMRIASALWWYYISKVIEFLDTIFFVLRKKNGQISFLHVYHHATMFPIWWIGVKWVPGGQSFMGAMINSFIHVLMYTYYGLAALGPNVQKYLWWKHYLTRLQLIQFVYGMFHAITSLYLQCPFPVWMQWALIFYGTTILSLFLNFYYQAYIKAHQKRAQKKQLQRPSHKVEATSNGASKKQKNGYIMNGKKSD